MWLIPGQTLNETEDLNVKFFEIYIKNKGLARLIVSAGIVFMTLTMTGCKKDDKPVSQKSGPPEVGIVVVETKPVPLTAELAGRTSAYLIAEVRPQVGGILQKRLFTEGTNVNAGEILYQIDPATYKAAYNSAKAALAKAEANLIPARLNADRLEGLVKMQAVSRQDHDNATAAVKQAEADVESAKAAVEATRINLDYTKVVAPISGRIGKSTVTTGALVTASQPTALATIQQLDPIYVDVTCSSADMLTMKQAMARGEIKKTGADKPRVDLVLENGRPYPLKGTLEFYEATVEQSTGSIALRTVFPNPDDILLPGMYVRAIIQVGITEKGILVPQQGVSRNQKGDAIAFVVDDTNTARQRMLQLSRAIGDQWLVLSGLSAGDRLIVEGIQRVRAGTVVKTVPFTEKKIGQAPAAGPDARSEKQIEGGK